MSITVGGPLWLGSFITAPTRDVALQIAVENTPGIDRVAAWMRQPARCMEFGKMLNENDVQAGYAWSMLGFAPSDPAAMRQVLATVRSLIEECGRGIAPECIARLKVWREIADGKQIAEAKDMFATVRKIRVDSAPTAGPSNAVMLLDFDRWDAAASWLHAQTDTALKDLEPLHHLLPLDLLLSENQVEVRRAIDALVDRLFKVADRRCGDLSIGWMMLTADPRQPTSFNRFLPQLQRLVDNSGDDGQKKRIEVWWNAAKGERAEVALSIFAVAGMECDVPDIVEPAVASPSGSAMLHKRVVAANTVVVMPAVKAVESGMSSTWKSLLDEAIPLAVAAGLKEVRRRLHAEYPQATKVIDGLLQDVREGKPVRMPPTILLGPPGTGKSRLVRRIAEELGSIYVSRYDCASAHDGMFSGSPRAWANSQASVPARAILQGRIANPIVMLDEVEKCGSGTHNGRLWDGMIPFLERETSGRYRETGLEAELDLSWISYIATANSIDELPGPLRDRFRVLKMPSPTLDHLPALAAQMMRDLARHDEDRMHDAPLADDELEIIGRAWKAKDFSMRRLQRIVATTLEVRDAMARRH